MLKRQLIEFVLFVFNIFIFFFSLDIINGKESADGVCVCGCVGVSEYQGQ